MARQGPNLFEKFEAKFELGYYGSSLTRNIAASKTMGDWLVPSIKWTLPYDASWVSVCYYCEGNLGKSKRYAKDCVRYTLDYFFGGWRKKILTDEKTADPEWWRRHSMWIRPFSEGLCWATALGEWKAVVNYPASDSGTPIEGTKEDRAGYYALACLVRGGNKEEIGSALEIVRRGKREKPKKMATVIEALQARAVRRFQDALGEYHEYFRQKEFRKKQISKLLCFDGTTFLNLGRRYGLSAKVDPSVSNHLISFE